MEATEAQKQSEQELSLLKIEHAVLLQDMDDLLYILSQILGIIGLEMKDLRDFDDSTFKKTMKGLKSTILMATADEDGFGQLFAHFAPDVVRLGLKYDGLIEKIIQIRGNGKRD